MAGKGRPDWAYPPNQDADTGLTRERHEPGTVFECSDVRVKPPALAATNLWRRPLPEVTRDHVMEPGGT